MNCVWSVASYRNQLLHIFQWEGAIAIVIAALAGMKSSRKKKCKYWERNVYFELLLIDL